jgi:two-component sensor histidine kinase
MAARSKSTKRRARAAPKRAAERAAPAAPDGVETELRAIIAAQDQRFRKLTHRLKNNLQLVISILSLRLSAVRDAERRAELEDVLAKIHAVALIQKQLHDGGRLLDLDFDAFLRELTANLQRPPAGAPPRVSLTLEPLTLGIERAMPLGLIANELIALATQDAGERPVAVRLARHAGKAALTIERADFAVPDRPGRPDAGLQLVRALARQAQAELTLDPGAVRLTFDPDPAA